MTQDAQAWVATFATVVWLSLALLVVKTANTALLIVSTIAMIATIGVWLWYAFSTQQYAFVALICFFIIYFVGAYNASYKS